MESSGSATSNQGQVVPREPLSSHWADTTALKLLKKNQQKQRFVLASGITPSGSVHVGNFREVITVDLVARALRDLGREVRFLYSWDNFDTLRKVPKNVPEPEAFEQYLRQPIARIPDPWGEEASYAAGRIAAFERELAQVGIAADFLYQESLYAAGTYASGIRQALENLPVLRRILNQYRSEPLAEDWLPTQIYCEKCQRDSVEEQRYEGEWSYSYRCSCGHAASVDIRSCRNLKLVWRVDWPMRWAHEGVDFEPGGKDHSSDGGSYSTGKEIVKDVFGCSAPDYLQYDFVGIKGGSGKMSSSSGNLLTVSEVLEVYEPQLLRWIFVSQRPNHDFAIALDEDVFKLYDEFDRAEAKVFASRDELDHSSRRARRSYLLSHVDHQAALAERQPQRAPFRALCDRLQICGEDPERALARYYPEIAAVPADRESFLKRAACALSWLRQHAAENFRYSLRHSPAAIEAVAADSQLKVALLQLRRLVEKLDLEALTSKELNELIWSDVIKKHEVEAQSFFQTVYQALISRDRGPRLPTFLREIGKDRLLEILPVDGP